ncbi:hypothetical protein F3Y22_tig00110332pilonHSYRG01354 [Hibiscus syriacus]|uniref:RING-type domain-containing protein n=1 Tax=Hibiscus syriacus TaxID=106335 RepID=A0A6A3B0Y2_HIBSY|nr:E3 ubiquitin-protein ligase RNF34-like [Hibiscus syriacus]KAE8709347.1 hypothetical protein F3Y22_tig00110332pilonHSYRG01354 [Hibiscus syriacus]
MSAADNGRNNPVQPRTLLDIIKDDRSIKDKKSWKTFRDKLRLKRAGSAWTSSVRVPASDVNVHTSRPRSSPRGPHYSTTATDTNHSEDRGEHVSASNPKDGPRSKSLKPLTMVRHPSGRISTKNDDDEDDDIEDEGDDDDYGFSGEEEDGSESPLEATVEKRSLSAREAVAAQEAAEAAAAAAVGGEEPVKMSLMDLLGETGYAMGDDEENEDEEEDNVSVSSRGGMEYTCCVCMVRHKGSAFTPCAHTFCRLCSRELMVQRGNCPLCHGYILEILDIF